MTNPTIFDDYATKYREAVNASIAITGDSVEDFARFRAGLVRDELGADAKLRVLDFGCGTGISTAALVRALPGLRRVVGVDPSADSIAQARESRGGESIEFVDQPGDCIPLADGAVDAVFTSCVFHHIERTDHAHWVREIHRVLAPGGSVFVFEHNPYNPLTLRAVRTCPFDEGVILLEPGYTRSILSAASFAVSGARFYYFFPRFAAALRPAERWMRAIPLGAQYYVRGMKPGR